MEFCPDKTASGTPLPDPARVEAARTALSQEGHTVRSWAKRNDEPAALVYKVLTGRRPCIMGASRRIAEKLNIVGEPAAADHGSAAA